MLKLTDIRKNYKVGGAEVPALKGISIEFRKNEFVAILGQSGCGKTTMLNIIGGLDKYTSGDLEIKGRSTAKYTDRDWDTYRNHSVGFVFQSYNLIPHQTVLANVELALTLSGVKKAERRKRAAEALEKVGLKDEMNKKPNQLSGGQMQRVAIARAIVNNPEILLADEPTGALDSETSVQVMDILREIASDRLVIMVTHNPELAEQYATRIVRLHDGLITDDSMPFDSSEEKEDVPVLVKAKNRSMSFLTALGLSVNNLLTKKGRTIMTCFAGSIGIIGIALILSVSQGVNNFIDKIQEDTLTKYPLTIDAESVDMASLLEGMGGNEDDPEGRVHEPGKIYSGAGIAKLMKTMSSITVSRNNVTDFKKFIDQSEEFKKHASAVKYTYKNQMNLFYESNGKIEKSDSESVLRDMYAAMGVSIGGTSSSMLSAFSSGMSVWEELLSGNGGEPVSPILTEQYDIVAGRWPEKFDEVVLVVSENYEVSDFVLYTLGLKSASEMTDVIEATMRGEEIKAEELSWTNEEILDLRYRLILTPDMFTKQKDGTWINMSETENGMKLLFNDPTRYSGIKVVGIIQPNENALFNMLSGAIGYTYMLTDYIIDKTAESELVKTQLADAENDAILGLPFRTEKDEHTTEEDRAKVSEFISALPVEEKAAIALNAAAIPDDAYINSTFETIVASMTRDELIENIVATYSDSMGGADPDTIRQYLSSMTDEAILELIYEPMSQMIAEQYAEGVYASLENLPADQLAMMLNADSLTDKQIEFIKNTYLPAEYSESNQQDNLAMLGYVDKDSPSEIIIYASTFSDKNKISDLVDDYNRSAEEEDKIKMTDYVKLLMSSVSTVINAISYVLIAFVGISLVVSSIMIGVITNISVLERTKEIGILRAVGASKGDIARVFNAETFIIGLFAGLLGIAVTLILIIPINLILHHFTGLMYLSAVLPFGYAVTLVILSLALTVIAGLIPARSASAKDPVVALRSE